MQRLKRHNHLSGRTVRVRDDVLLAVVHHGVWVHLRHDQRNVRIVAVKRRVIDHHAASRSHLWRVFLSRVRPDGEQGNVRACEVICVEIKRLERLVAIGAICAQRSSAGQCDDLIGRELPVGEDVQHFAAHVSGGAYDSDFIAHLLGLQIGRAHV